MSDITITIPGVGTRTIQLPPGVIATEDLVKLIQSDIAEAAPNIQTDFKAALASGNFDKFNTDITYLVNRILVDIEHYKPCFCDGTLIRTTRGDVAVETLNVGDVVVTASGAARPIKWLGQRGLAKSQGTLHAADMPVRIRAGAFGQGLPFADLRVSPGHHICIDMIGEVLLSASRLINGSTIVQEKVSSTTYWHVELDSHDVILANGLPAESYLDCDNRGFFIGDGDHPDAMLASAEFCRPLLTDEMLVGALRARLRMQAIAMGWSIDEQATKVLLSGAASVLPEMFEIDGLSAATWKLPVGSKGVVLHSSAFRPYHYTDQNDLRDLGLRICKITIGGEEISLERLTGEGFHSVEKSALASWRWTKDIASLPDSLFDLTSALSDGSETVSLTIAFGNRKTPTWVEPVGRARPSLSLVA